MTGKKKLLYGILVLLIIGIIYGFSYGIRYAYIGSSYDAKIVCSCVFISHRDLSEIKKEDLYAVPFAHIEVDLEHQSVSSDVYGLAKTKAIYRPGLGCTLVNGLTEEEIHLQSKPEVIPQSSDTLSLSILPQGIDSSKLYNVISAAFKETDSTKIKRTRAVAILHHGKLIAEQYAPGFNLSTPLLGWSMTKSVTNAMIGILVRDGLIQTNQSNLLEEWKNDDRKKITLDNLLRMSSGLDFVENYTSPSDATTMLFRSSGAGKYAILSKLKSPPGTVWYYSSGTSNILQEIIRRQFKSLEEYQAFPHLRLFAKIGMKSAIIEPDASGTYIGSSFMYATARDWAKFGQLYLQDGTWNGEQILPEGWVTYSSKETPHSNGRYGAQFWMDHNDKTFPQDAYFADGFEGQFVVIIPSKQLVIVRLGCTQNDGFEFSTFVKDVVSAVH